MNLGLGTADIDAPGTDHFLLNESLAERRSVFLQGIELNERLNALPSGGTLILAEIGFGAGVNFLLTLQEWLTHRPPHTRLHYLGLDDHPLRKSMLEQALEQVPQLYDLASMLLADWPPPIKGCHRVHWPQWGVTLDLWWENTEDALVDLASRNRAWVNCWYFTSANEQADDALADQSTAQTSTAQTSTAQTSTAQTSTVQTSTVQESYAAIRRLSQHNASIAGYSSSVTTAKALQAVGFELANQTSVRPKRECFNGHLSTKTTGRIRATPWDLNPSDNRPESVIVIGAGLAGAFIARSLAERGIKVTVLDKGSIASGGSSNLQGLTYTRLSHRFAPLGDFSNAAYDHGTRLYQQLLRARALIPGDDADACGYLQVGNQETLEKLSGALESNHEFAEILTPTMAATRLGINHAGLYFPNALWLHPPAVCRERLNHPLIKVQENCGSIEYAHVNGQWQLTGPDGLALQTTTLVLATAGNVGSSPFTDWLPLQAIRGQVTHVPANMKSRQLRCALCHDGYFPPQRHGVHCIGATYGPNDQRLDERIEDHEFNVNALSDWMPDLGFSESSTAHAGHVALRCTTADYLPIAGPVPDRDAFNRQYAALSKRKSMIISEPSPVVPGLWVLGGLGSRGLTAAPLAAESIAADMLGEPPPLPRYLQQAISPARFLHRALVRGAPL